jgi:hypothetical protein
MRIRTGVKPATRQIEVAVVAGHHVAAAVIHAK